MTFLITIAAVRVLIIDAHVLEANLTVIAVVIAVTSEVAVDALTILIADLIRQTGRAVTAAVVDRWKTLAIVANQVAFTIIVVLATPLIHIHAVT